MPYPRGAATIRHNAQKVMLIFKGNEERREVSEKDKDTGTVEREEVSERRQRYM